MALANLNIIPDKFILLEVNDNITIDCVKASMENDDNPVQFQED